MIRVRDAEITITMARLRARPILLPLLLTGCAAVNPYAKWYETFPERVPADSVVSPKDVWIVIGRNPHDEVPVLLRNGYAVVGTSRFNGPVTKVTDGQLRQQAAKVGAQVVMQWAALAEIKGWAFDSDSLAPTRQNAGDAEVRANYGAMYFVGSDCAIAPRTPGRHPRGSCAFRGDAPVR